MNHLCGEKLQLTTLENSINRQSAERIGKGKHGGRAPATKLRSRNKSLLTQSIRNIEEERGRVPIPPSIAERMLGWRRWWMMRENKSRCRSQGWLYHTVPLQLDPKWAAKTTRSSLEWSRDKTFSASAAPLPQSSSSLPALIGQKESFPGCSLDYGKDILSWLGETFSQLLSAISTRTGCSSGAALSLLSRQKVPGVFRTKGNHSFAFTTKRWEDRNDLQPFSHYPLLFFWTCNYTNSSQTHRKASPT